jgi:oxygen-independent coproporphyrinogen-3 oxidase
MNDDTLQLIGRKHNSQMVYEAGEWARSAGIKNINMDLIIGLPGENINHFIASAERISDIRPDNVTVHTLAVKRGSGMAEIEGRVSSTERADEVEWGIRFYDKFFKQQGYKPYYLYRQKYMKASMENTGYAIAGTLCKYNVQMIEERQTIIGMGGGASSKFINTSDWTLSSLHNPKDPHSYVKTIEKLITSKVDKLGALN